MSEIVTFNNQAMQGDVCINRIAEVPADAKPVEPVEGLFVVAHSETGHHHAIAAMPGVVEMFGSSDPNVAFLRVKSAPVLLKHFRADHQHKTLQINPGSYEIKRQQEHGPEGWKKVVD